MQIAVFRLFREHLASSRKGNSSQLNMQTVKILKSKVILLSVIPNKFYCFLRRNTKIPLPFVDFGSLSLLSHENTSGSKFSCFNSFPVIFVKCYLRNCRRRDFENAGISFHLSIL